MRAGGNGEPLEGLVLLNDVSFCSAVNRSIWDGLIASSEALVITQINDDSGLKLSDGNGGEK